MEYKAHTQSAEDVLDALQAGKNGLPGEKAEERLKKHGENKLPESKPPPVWLVFLRQFMSPLIYILLFAGVVTIFMQQYSGAVFIFGVLLVNAVIGALQEHSATKEAAALKKMSTPTARIKRSGKVQEIEATKLVPGDIVLLESGNKIPADLRLLEESELRVDESLLTGESKNEDKNAGKTLEEDTSLGDRINMAFAGTVVTHGRGTGVVVHTGGNTEMGAIASDITEDSRAKSPLVIRMHKFTCQVSIAIGIIIILISGILYWRGTPWEEIFMTAIGLAVASIPEGLPVTVTIALALAMRRMAERNVIVRKLPAVEALGSCTLIAADKTGTLTQNKLTVEKIALPDGNDISLEGGHG